MIDDEYRDNLYSPLQSQVLSMIPMFTASMSVLGSSIIIFIILSDRRRKLQRVYHRLLLVYSSVDLCFSINLGLSALVVPKGTPGVWGASGNQATCEASGFISQFGQSNGLYAAFICLYYLLVLRYDVREDIIAKWMEPVVHLLAFVFPLAIAILMISLNMYNPTNIFVGWCFINVYPADCLRREEIKCERGENYAAWSMVNNVPFMVYFAIVLVSSVLTYLQVRKLELRTSSLWNVNYHSRFRSKETSIQAILYILAFVFTYGVFGGVTLFGPSPATEENRHIYFPLSVLIKIFLPLQGFWNCFIYLRPRFSALKRRNRNLKCWYILKQIIFHSNEAAAQTRQEQRNLDRALDHRAMHSGSVPLDRIVVENGHERDEFTPEIDTNERSHELYDHEIYGPHAYSESESGGFQNQVFRMDILLDHSSQESSRKREESVLSRDQDLGSSRVEVQQESNKAVDSANETKAQNAGSLLLSNQKPVEDSSANPIPVSGTKQKGIIAASPAVDQSCVASSQKSAASYDESCSFDSINLVDQRGKEQQTRRSIAFLTSTVSGETGFDNFASEFAAKLPTKQCAVLSAESDNTDRRDCRFSLFQFGGSRKAANTESRRTASRRETDKRASAGGGCLGGNQGKSNDRRKKAPALFSRTALRVDHPVDVINNTLDETR